MVGSTGIRRRSAARGRINHLTAMCREEGEPHPAIPTSRGGTNGATEQGAATHHALCGCSRCAGGRGGSGTPTPAQLGPAHR